MSQQMVQPMQMTIPQSALEPVICEQCGKEIFLPSVLLKRVSAIYSPTGSACMIQVAGGFCCAFCGAAYDQNMNKLDFHPELDNE